MQPFRYRIFPIYRTRSSSLTGIVEATAYFCYKSFSMYKVLCIAFLFFLIACNNNTPDTEVKVPDAPKTMSYSITGTFPHDTSSYTQGLLIYNGELYEGTGLNEKSKLMKVDLKTGKALQSIKLDAKYFGEGVTILNDTVYQLTWQNNVVFVYTLKDLKKIKEFPITTEGWGLTNDGKNLIVSTGSSDLFYYDPATFKLLKTQTVTESGTPSFNLNELEYIDGYVYANQYQYPYIFKIDPANGQIVAKADLNAMWERVRAIDPHAEVPNGIAYDAAAKKVYITGKLWPELYEVEFSK